MNLTAELPTTCFIQVSQRRVVGPKNAKEMWPTVTQDRTEPSVPREPNGKRVRHEPDGLSVQIVRVFSTEVERSASIGNSNPEVVELSFEKGVSTERRESAAYHSQKRVPLWSSERRSKTL